MPGDHQGDHRTGKSQGQAADDDERVQKRFKLGRHHQVDQESGDNQHQVELIVYFAHLARGGLADMVARRHLDIFNRLPDRFVGIAQADPVQLGLDSTDNLLIFPGDIERPH